jgi:hypothetical protein
VLEQVPRIRLLDIEREVLTPGHEVDIVAHIDVSGRRHALLCEVKSDGQPRRAAPCSDRAASAAWRIRRKMPRRSSSPPI